MTVPTSYASYAAEFELYEQALKSKNGIRFKVEDRGAGNYLRMRLHYARDLDRQRNREIYAVDAPEYGQSSFDPLIVRVKVTDGAAYVYIEPRLIIAAVEELPGAAE